MPTVPVRTKLHHVNDCQIRALLTDPDGGTATYDDWVDVPGIKTVAISGTVETQSLTGDNILLDSDTQLTSLTVAISHAKVSLDVLAIMTGSAVTTTGTTPAQKTRYRLLGDDEPAYWQLRAKSTGVDFTPGDGHLDLPKCKINSFPDIGLAERDYRILSAGGVCLPRLADKVWFDIEFNETAIDIADVA